MSNTHSIGVASGATLYKATTGEAILELRNKDGVRLVRADRSKLRNWLATSLDIQWNKKFVRYEEDANSVTVHFEDGSTATGDIIVGADGQMSHGKTAESRKTTRVSNVNML